MTQIKVVRAQSPIVTNDPAVTNNPFYNYKDSGVSKLPVKKGNGDFASNPAYSPDPNKMKAIKNKASTFSPGKDNQIKS